MAKLQDYILRIIAFALLFIMTYMAFKITVVGLPHSGASALVVLSEGTNLGCDSCTIRGENIDRWNGEVRYSLARYTLPNGGGSRADIYYSDKSVSYIYSRYVGGDQAHQSLEIRKECIRGGCGFDALLNYSAVDVAAGHAKKLVCTQDGGYFMSTLDSSGNETYVYGTGCPQ